MSPLRRTPEAISLAILLLAVALSGCGSDSSTATAPPLPPITKVVAVSLRSSAIHGSRLPALYTCDGRNISPPLTWGTVPPGIGELALFAVGIKPSRSGQLSKTVDWAMAGVSPSLHHLSAGQIPRGAFLEEASDGKKRYSICPAKGQTEHYEFALYALPPRVRATPAINGTGLLHNLTGKILQGRSPATGEFSATYTRP
jgi:phosphatidylethanolamine-binding protein (PEBP) family uncharacterized protein